MAIKENTGVADFISILAHNAFFADSASVSVRHKIAGDAHSRILLCIPIGCSALPRDTWHASFPVCGGSWGNRNVERLLFGGSALHNAMHIGPIPRVHKIVNSESQNYQHTY
jgi:hypothetical protein